MICTACGTSLPDGSRFCGACGTTLGPSACPTCGREVAHGTKFCVACGSSLVGQPPGAAMPAPAAAMPAAPFVPSAPVTAKKKGRRLVMGFGVGLGVPLVLVLLIGGYLGFVPVLSNLMGANTPKDLGVTYTAADLVSAHSKGSSVPEAVNRGMPIRAQAEREPKRAVDTSFSMAEASQILNEHFPISNAQMRIGPSGLIEISGLIRSGRVDAFAALIGMPARDLGLVKRIFTLASSMSFYLSGYGSVQSGQVQVSFTNAQLGRLPLTSLFQRHSAFIASYLAARSNAIPGHSVQMLQFQNGQMQFQGTVPERLPAI